MFRSTFKSDAPESFKCVPYSMDYKNYVNLLVSKKKAKYLLFCRFEYTRFGCCIIISVVLVFAPAVHNNNICKHVYLCTNTNRSIVGIDFLAKQWMVYKVHTLFTRYYTYLRIYIVRLHTWWSWYVLYTIGTSI